MTTTKKFDLNKEKNVAVLLARRSDGVPKESDFKIEERELRPLQNDEILVRNVYLSMDPFIYKWISAAKREYMFSIKEGEIVPSFGIGEVVASQTKEFAVGDIVWGGLSWSRFHYSKITTESEPQKQMLKIEKLDRMSGVPMKVATSLLGCNGLAAWFGIVEIANPKYGETVLVTGAHGGTGILAGQLAKIKGCKVIGITSSDEKAKDLKQRAKFDEVINYKKVDDLHQTLLKVAPFGIDIVFDTVGGDFLELVFSNLAVGARIFLCGMVSQQTQYDSFEKCNLSNYALSELIYKRAKIQGFSFFDYEGHYHTARKRLSRWFVKHHLHVPIDLRRGVENLPKSFIDLFAGEHSGKIVVQVNDEVSLGPPAG